MHGTREPGTALDLEGQVADLIRPLVGGEAEIEPTASILAVAPDALPQPHRDLLVQSEGMSTTLAAYWHEPLELRVVAARREGKLLARHVVVVTSRSRRAAAYGAIRIHLERFEARVLAEIVDGRKPLGAILHEHRVEHRSQPTGFFLIEPNEVMRTSLGVRDGRALHGRHNVILDSSHSLMAEVVDILSPETRDPGDTDP